MLRIFLINLAVLGPNTIRVIVLAIMDFKLFTSIQYQFKQEVLSISMINKKKKTS